MSFARNFSLHPELVSDVIEELLDADIIHRNCIKQLKCESKTLEYDPNALMDSRHEQVKIRSTVSFKLNGSINDKRVSNKKSEMCHRDFVHVDKEIEKFKRELEAERKKLYELSLESKNKIKSTSKQNKLHDPIPVTNVVVTQPKNMKNIKVLSPKNYTTEDISENCNGNISFESYLTANDLPIEVCGYKPLSMTTPMNNKRCLNEQSPLCPHSHKSNDINNDRCKTKNKIAEYQMLHNKYENDAIENKNDKVTITHHVENKTMDVNKRLVDTTIIKWKNFVIQQKQNRCSRDEKMFKIKYNKQLLKKYWDQWVNYYKNNKELKDNLIKQNERRQKLNLFFEKLEERKKDLTETKSLLTDVENTNKSVRKNSADNENNKKINTSSLVDKTSVFVNRLNAQKSIIEEQKMKLQEQEKLIRELKEQKLQESLKDLNISIENNIKETIKICDNKSMKPQAKKLANKLNMYTDNTQKLTECNIVSRMNERAKERKEKWEIIRMRKHIIEEEKKRKKIEEEERKRNEEEQLKRKLIRERKEQIKLQKEIELRRLLDIEEIKEKMEVARRYYKFKLLCKVINILKKNVSLQRQLEYKCVEYFKKKLLKNCFGRWHEETYYMVRRNIIIADTFYTFNLMYKCLMSWIHLYNERIQKEQVAEDFYDIKLQEKAFNMWIIFTNKMYIENERKIEVAVNYYERKLMTSYFNKWKQLPKSMYNIREEEKRIRMWREKVLEVIPDFKPELICDDEEK